VDQHVRDVGDRPALGEDEIVELADLPAVPKYLDAEDIPQSPGLPDVPFLPFSLVMIALLFSREG